ncbi:DUF1499 domain-containing protein [Oceanicaulis alexandrii]|uniref:DUF1499 domain-containing protein n=1 Tax=Oceanicaulis alexandrii TaxID=153233 RepID=UPI0023536BEF|nr:DUF1499 domain-containing protein [Oceanicaulis alexandrii]
MAERPFPLDFATLVPDARPRRWLVLPTGFDADASPDQHSPVFEQTPEALLEAFKAVALAAPRVALVREEAGQIELVQRSKLFRFPDYITVQAFEAQGGAALAIYSRAVIGYSDMGVNRKRIKGWLESLQASPA